MKQQFSLKTVAAITIVLIVLVGFVISVMRTPGDAQASADLKNIFGTTTTTALDTGIPHEHLEGEGHSDTNYLDVPVASDEFAAKYPQSRSGLSKELFDRARLAGQALVTADETGNGRSNFPGYWPSNSTATTSPSKSITVDFSSAMSVWKHPDLVRAIVIWHGDAANGEQIVQTRQSVYFTIGPQLKPVKRQNLPNDVIGWDTWIDGERFTR